MDHNPKENTDPGAQQPSSPLAMRFLQFELKSQIESLRQEKAYQHGRISKILAKHSDFRVVLVVMKAGNRMVKHSSAGRVSVETVTGHLRMHAGEAALDMPAGNLVILDRAVPHDVEAIEDSAFLLTMATPENQGT